MEPLYAAIALLTQGTTSLILARASRPARAVEAVLLFWVYASAQIVLVGGALSLADALAEVSAWALANTLLLTGVWALPWSRRGFRGMGGATLRLKLASLRQAWDRLSARERLILGALSLSVGALGLLNLALVLCVAPRNWDSMTYHLARMGYYLQHGNVRAYGANYWAQVTHPRNATLLQIFAFLVTGKNENLLQSIQFLSYWVTACAIYGIARRCGQSRRASLFAALISALLVESLMEAVTTQNDLLLTSYLAVAVYALLAFRESSQRRYLAWAGLSTALAVGVKASTLIMLPALGVVAVYALFAGGHRLRDILSLYTPDLLVALALSSLFLALPSGYLDNYVLYGHPLGPESVREMHSFEGAEPGYVLKWGSYNTLRYGFEFLSLDGLPAVPPVLALQDALREWPIRAVEAAGIDLATDEATRGGFWWRGNPPMTYEDASYWGVLGFALLLPVVLWALLSPRTSPARRTLALAATAFWLAQAYSGPLDTWRGRYFVTMAIFAAPLAAPLLDRVRCSGWLNAYLVAIVLCGCVTGMTAVLLRQDSPVIAPPGWTGPAVFCQKSVFRLSRRQQMTCSRPAYDEPLRRFEESVPADATVALLLPGDTYEYPLFGCGLTRTLLPINPFDEGPQPPPAGADYVLLSSRVASPAAGDLPLGQDWYLRRQR